MTFWMTAEATGSQYTGAWPIGGKTFVFADSNDSEKILDEFTVGRAPCPIAEFEEDGSWQKPHQ